jgi:two-component system chemotaxis response regulator CheB
MSRLIVIGASVGGVRALTQLASALPASLPAPVMVVLHTGAHRSVLPSLLSARSALQVSHAEHDETIRDGYIYVAPPDYHMLVVDRRIVLTRGAKEHHTRPAIDPLFRSAALAYGPAAIGVVLTGRLDDGTAGLQVIKQRGGIAVVQDPADAFAPSMPASALKYVAADHCVPLASLPALLTSLVSTPVQPVAADSDDERPAHEQELTLRQGDVMDHLHAIGSQSSFACPDCHGTLWEVRDSRPKRYRCHTGHGFTARTLQEAMATVSDEATWSALRSLQERELLLQDMIRAHRAEGDHASATRLETASKGLGHQVASLYALLEESPEPLE